MTITAAGVVATALVALSGVPHVVAEPAGDFTACMRAHGQPGFPAGTVTDDGRLRLEPGAVAFDPFSSTYRDAAATCADELPDGTALPADPQPPSAPPPVPAMPEPPAPPAAPAP